jgi:hypothetical protein
VKGCLVIVGFAVLGFALLLGVTITVERVGAARNEPLTGTTTQVEFTEYEQETHSSSSGRSGRSTVKGANVRFRYKADDRWFESTESVWHSQADLSDDAVCFDPDDPAQHVLRGNAEATCGEGNFGTVRRAREVAP